MTYLNRLFTVLLVVAMAAVPCFSQEESSKAEGLRKVASYSWADDLDIDIDEEALEASIESAVRISMESVERAIERLEIHIEPIEIDMDNININTNPVKIEIPNINIDIEPIEVDDIDMDIDHDHDHDMDIDHDYDHEIDSDNQVEDDDEDLKEWKEKFNKDKSEKDKSDKDDKDRAKGLKKIN